MTIASAFNEIAVAQGGAASKSGSIAGAIDALNDALAGSDQQAAQTIEDAVRLLGANIGSGGGGGGLQTATLTVVNNANETVLLQVPNIIEYQGVKALNISASAKTSSTSILTVPIIGVTACLLVSEGMSIAISGDIDGEDGEYYITGDATMTAS